MQAWQLKDNLDLVEYGESWLTLPKNQELLHGSETALLRRIEGDSTLRNLLLQTDSNGDVNFSLRDSDSDSDSDDADAPDSPSPTADDRAGIYQEFVLNRPTSNIPSTNATAATPRRPRTSNRSDGSVTTGAWFWFLAAAWSVFSGVNGK